MARAPLAARAALRLLVACIAMTAGIALAACGGDDDASGSELSKITELSEGQYTAIEKVYVASLPLDDLDDVTKPAYKRAVNSVVAVCDQLDEDDPLLGEVKATCPVTAELVDTTVAAFGCSDPDECVDTFEAAQASAQRALQASRDSDAAVNATRLPPSCKKALVTAPETYAQGAALERALGKVARAIKTEPGEDDAAALRAIKAIDDLAEEPSAQENLDRLRRNCR